MGIFECIQADFAVSVKQGLRFIVSDFKQVSYILIFLFCFNSLSKMKYNSNSLGIYIFGDIQDICLPYREYLRNMNQFTWTGWHSQYIVLLSVYDTQWSRCRALLLLTILISCPCIISECSIVILAEHFLLNIT